MTVRLRRLSRGAPWCPQFRALDAGLIYLVPRIAGDPRRAACAVFRTEPVLKEMTRDCHGLTCAVTIPRGLTPAGFAKANGPPFRIVKAKAEFKRVTAADVFSMDATPLLARTVHDVKGESHESVLLVVQPRHGQNDQAGLWSQPLLGEEVDEAQREELRIAYVALTRAERYCAVALPANIDEASLQAYRGVGFVHV